jgi:hypothetical protein
MPLNEVATRLDLTGRKEGRDTMWRNDRFAINVTGNKFYDHKNSHGGTGAVSLVMHVRGCTFREAVGWLTGQQHEIDRDRQHHSFFPQAATAADADADGQRRPFAELFAEKARKSEAAWVAARNYLTRTRGISQHLADRLYHEGKIFANDHKPNTAVVFLHHDADGQPLGCSLRGTYDPKPVFNGQGEQINKPFKSCLGSKTDAWFTIGDLRAAREIVVVESPVDALSYATLTPSSRQVVIVSVSGNFIPEKLLHCVHERNRDGGCLLTVALDNDEAGDAGHRRAVDMIHEQRLNVSVTRERSKGKDWNEDLQRLRLNQKQSGVHLW